MSNHLKSFALATLVFSLTCGVGLAANDVVVKHTLAQTAASSDGKAEADKLFQEGVQQFRRGEYPKALQTYQRVLEIRQQLGDKAGIGQTLNNIGQVYNLVQPEKALEVLQQALTIRREIKDRAGEGETLDNIGGAYLALDKDEEALKTLQQALEIRREVKDKAGEAVTLSRMGLTYTFLKQQDKGLKLLQQALAMHKELGDKYQEGLTLFRIAGAYSNIDNYPNALDWYNKALAVNREIGNRAWEGRSLQQIGLIYLNKKEYDNALKFLQQSLPLIQEAGIRDFEASIFNNIGNTYFNQQKYDRAIEAYQQALPIARQVKDKSLESRILISLGDSYTKQEKYEKTLEFYQQALPLANKNTEQEARILALIGVSYIQQGKYDLAIENLQKSLISAREIKNKVLEFQALTGIGLIYSLQKKYDKAIEFSQQALALQRETPNNRSAQLEILMQIMSIYFGSASDLTLKKDYSPVIIQANEALKLVPDTLKLARELNNSTAEKEILQIQSQSYSLIGNYHLQLRELEKAEKFIQQGLNIARQSENLDAEKYALSFLPDVYKDQGDISKVIELGQRELEIAKQLKDPTFEAQALLSLATTYGVLGDFDKSIQFSQQALSKSNEIDIQKLPKYSQSHAYYQKLSALGFLSLVYTNIGKYDKAFEYAQQRLNFAKTLKKPEFEASALIALGDVYQNNQEFQRAIELTQQSLKIAKEINNIELEVEALKKLSAASIGKGDYQQALEYSQQVFLIAEKTKNFRIKIDALDIQRQIYTKQGNYKKTLELFQEALSVAKQNIDPYSEWSSLIEIGLFYKTLGDEQQSTEYLQQSLTLSQKIKNPQREGISLFIIAYSYFGKDQPQKIIEYANRGLAILPKTKEITVEIIGNIVLGLGYGELNNEPKAMAAAQASLELARKSKNPGFEKYVLTFIGDLQRKFGKKQEAIQTYNQALAIKVKGKAVGANSGIYAGLGRAYADLNQPKLAISYYKEAINRIEEVRSGIKLLTPELQASFLQATVDFGKVKTSDIYRQLADLLSSQGRNAEAQQILELLALQNINDFTRQTRSTAKVTDVELSSAEKQIINKHGTLIAFGKQLAECKNKCSQLSSLKNQYRQLTEEFNQLVKNIQNSEVDKSGIDKVYDRTSDLIAGASKIVDEQTDTVLIYPLVLKDKIRILWASKGGVFGSKVCKMGESELTKDVTDFRKLLQNSSSDIKQVKATGKKLYDCLIQPVEAELKANKIKHLVFVPDLAINYIPMGALFDGEKYLLDNYTITSILNVGVTNFKDTLPSEVNKTQILGLGLSQEAKTPDGIFPALKNVLIELDSIIKSKPNDTKGIYPGDKLVDKDFNLDALENNLKGRNILHIATHALFKPKDPTKSYILLGTGAEYPIEKIQFLQNLRDVHLVVLSACETALGGSDQNGVEIQGISSYFLRDKAKAVMASLWKVDDPSTSQLMQLFYKNLATGKMTKSEALRQAQLSLLDGNNSSRNSEQRGITVNISPGTSSRNEKYQSGYSHPYYWAPFILIGNGL